MAGDRGAARLVSGLSGRGSRRVRAGARVRIATKVRYDPLVAHRWPESAEGLSAGAVTAGVAGSLSRRGVDAVDLLWAHGEDRAGTDAAGVGGRTDSSLAGAHDSGTG